MDMPLYQGTKQVRAKPMNRLDYNKLRGWELPADENGADEGFLVEYVDGGRPNVEGFDGYVSWSPADVFDRAYKPAETYIDRMQIELNELAARCDLLDSFTQSPMFGDLPFIGQGLMLTQLNVMSSYAAVLGMRLQIARSQEPQPADEQVAVGGSDAFSEDGDYQPSMMDAQS